MEPSAVSVVMGAERRGVQEEFDDGAEAGAQVLEKAGELQARLDPLRRARTVV